MLFTVSSHHITADQKVNSERTQDRNRMLLSSHQPLQPAQVVHPTETQDGKTQDSGPRELRAHQRSRVNEPGLLYLPTHKKSTNFSNLRYLVFLNRNLLKFLPGLCCKKLLYILATPLPSEQSLRAIREAAFWA